MAVNIETAIDWMKEREGKVSYSMDLRDGPDSYDCSSSIYYALRDGGASSAGWAVNTEYEHQWLIDNGYELISENTPWDAQRGDIFIWGRRGYSSGAGGHTGMFVDENNIIHCNYRFDGITVNDHDDIWMYAGRPYYYIYRLTDSGVQPDRIESGWQKNDTGTWYVHSDGSYPKDKFEKINGTWYYFDGSGYMLADRWKKHSDGNWYWFDNSGEMATGWKKIAEKWYYFDVEGAMKTGWVKYKDTWYYLDSKDGNMVSNEFVRAGQGWYYIKPDGTMADKPEFTVEPEGLITTK